MGAMARRALTPTCLTLVRRLEAVIPPIMATTGVSACRIGLSGGADSLALTAAMAWAHDHRLGPLAELDLTALVIDHGLQEGSQTVARLAAEQAETLGIRAEVRRVRVDPSRDGVEAAARQARYAALLDETARPQETPAPLILLAHTLDDQAETVLLGLARGSGSRSLAGMPVQRGRLVRPFLTIRRASTEQACRDWGLTWWQDPTNTDPAYTRSRLRAAMSTLNQALGPGLADSLARTADLCRADADLLDDLARQAMIDLTGSATVPPSHPEAMDATPDRSLPDGEHPDALPVTELQALAPPLRHRVLLTWLRAAGQDAVTRNHVLAVDSLLTHWHGQKLISVPGATVTRSGQMLRLRMAA